MEKPGSDVNDIMTEADIIHRIDHDEHVVLGIQEVLTITNDLDLLRTNTEEQQELLQEYAHKNEELEIKIIQMATNITSLETENVDLHLKIEEYEELIKKLHDDFEEKIKQKSDKNDDLRIENDSLKKFKGEEVNEREKVRSGLNNEIKHLRNQKEEKEKEIREMKLECEDLRTDLKRSFRRGVSKERENETLKAGNVKINEQKRAKDKTIRELSSKDKRNRDLIKNIEEENDNLKKQIRELERKMRKVEQEQKYATRKLREENDTAQTNNERKIQEILNNAKENEDCLKKSQKENENLKEEHRELELIMRNEVKEQRHANRKLREDFEKAQTMKDRKIKQLNGEIVTCGKLRKEARVKVFRLNMTIQFCLIISVILMVLLFTIV
ncbi:intracellular protein transport protein USO1-like [Anneissia japonica]|uniref:intracellular protein transport protein USO1-like n=1 Tax=Anneissia japonica TaxID=1529436 RepID=UPI001425971F|nr:intracellular protein transport protein USO1-like [Anneissia japonica]XP_033126459.1 intracellular protein transport protein USO1-like [Anneissia japonica]XP_033126460.1 intracellular protein transport protein USO1-like [Anneissia japonica]